LRSANQIFPKAERCKENGSAETGCLYSYFANSQQIAANKNGMGLRQKIALVMGLERFKTTWEWYGSLEKIKYENTTLRVLKYFFRKMHEEIV
jgi:hypothetical protein